jgi:hypothetical protein
MNQLTTHLHPRQRWTSFASSWALRGLTVAAVVLGLSGFVQAQDNTPGTTVLGSTTASSTGAWSFTPATAQSDATHTYTATAANAAGSFDATKVKVNDVIKFTDNATPANTKSVTITQAMIDAAVNGVGTATTTFTRPADGGTLTVTAQLFDVAGNGTPVSASDSATLDISAPTQTVTFSSMTKDSGLTSKATNADWSTNDNSAGRLVSGFLSAPLAADEFVLVFVDKGDGAGPQPLGIGSANGIATVAQGGTTWEITDTNAYPAGSATTAKWTYSAKVVDAAGNSGANQTQVVNADYSEAAPVITSVKDSTNTSIADAGTTSNPVSSVTGTGVAGDVIYLYDNTATNLVGSATVGGDGTWTVTGLSGNSGSHKFAAKQVDALSNLSVLSNTWAVTSGGTNLLANGDFSAGNTGFRSNGAWTSGNPLQTENTAYATGYDASNWSTAATTATATGTYTGGTYTNNYNGGVNNPNGKMTGKVLFGQNSGGTQNAWAEDVAVVAGQTYTFSFDYALQNYQYTESVVIDGVKIAIGGSGGGGQGTNRSGNFEATYTATSSKTITLAVETQSGGFNGNDFIFDNFNFTKAVAADNNSLVLGGTAPVSSGVDSVGFSGGPISTLAGNDTITASGTDIQAKLAAGGIINGGAGVDNLKLAAGTVLNLEMLTANQTVKSIQQVEMITMTGGSSKLTLSANDVLSLGASNESTMSAYTFSTTTLTPLNSVTPTSTSSAGKVQFVVNGASGDTLNLDSLANDGVTSTNGVSSGLLGNTGLAGTWTYKGEFSITASNSPDGLAHTYKVYDHSTTQAQVLVDVPVVVTTLTPISISAISNDSGPSSTDFVTNDQTLVYSGQLPATFNSGTERVLVQLTDSANVTTTLGFATVSGTGWTFDNQAVTQAVGTYTIKATIVGSANTTPVASYGTQGVSTQTLVIDTATPTVAVTRSGTGTMTAAETITFTLSEDSTTFTSEDVDVTGGTLTAFNGSGKSYTATFTPTAAATGTATVGVAAGKFTDAAGNANADTYVTGQGTNTQTDNQVNTAFNTIPAPTEVVSFLSMSRDNGGNNNDWKTSDVSAGRIVSGKLDKALDPSETLNVYSNGNLIGAAVVSGTDWEISDTNAYTADWTYTAKVTNVTGSSAVATQKVTTDITEAAPVITSVTDGANVVVVTSTGASASGTSNKNITALAGTGVAGDKVIVYDNSGANVVGSATVGSDGKWTLSGLSVAPGSNKFAAKQIDEFGNESLLSNTMLVSGLVVDNMVGTKTVGNSLVSNYFTLTDKFGNAGPGYKYGIYDTTRIYLHSFTDQGDKGVANAGGHDILKLAAGTTLDLTALTSTQTVLGLQSVEHFALQGSSSKLVLNVNDVLSLGGVGADTLAFSSTTLANGSTSSTSNTNHTQLVIDGTATDLVTLNTLLSNGGNSGAWQDMGKTGTINGHSYEVFNHSTTNAQVLIDTTIFNASHLTLG